MKHNAHIMIKDGAIFDRILTDAEFEAIAQAGLPAGWSAIHLELPITPQDPKVKELGKRPMQMYNAATMPFMAGIPFPVSLALRNDGVDVNLPPGGFSVAGDLMTKGIIG